MILPYMIIYLSAYFGVTLSGILLMISVIMGILASLLGGYYADRIGRKVVISVSEFVIAVSFLGMFISNTNYFSSPITAYLFFCINTVAFNISFPALNAMIIDVSTPESRKLIYSINYWITNLSLAIGSLIGAFLYSEFLQELLLSCFFMSMIIFFVFLFFIEESIPEQSEPRLLKIRTLPSVLFSEYSPILKDLKFLKFFFSSLLIMAVELQLTNFVTVRLNKEFGTRQLFGDLKLSGIEMSGILRTEAALLVVFCTFIVVKFTRKLSDKTTLTFGLLFFTIGYMVIAVSNDPALLMVSVLVLIIGELMWVPVSQSLLPLLIDDHKRTKYLAILNLHQRGGELIATLTLTLSSVITSWYISVFIGLMGFIALLMMRSLIITQYKNNYFNQKA
ncbi:DHA1 family multidrug resistance protein B-like MFS transporter [Paenibacillus sp. DS2015]